MTIYFPSNWTAERCWTVLFERGIVFSLDRLKLYRGWKDGQFWFGLQAEVYSWELS